MLAPDRVAYLDLGGSGNETHAHLAAAQTDQGRITVDGKALDETSYLHPGDEPSQMRFDVTVPAGKLWLMGDHRSDSLDSRAHLGDPGGGFVPVDRVIGRVPL